MNYVVFPGNVGDKNALLKAAITLGVSEKSPSEQQGNSGGGSQTPGSAPSSSSASSVKPSAAASNSKLLSAMSTALAHSYAIAAFNVYSLEGAKAVVAAAEMSRSPVILQVQSIDLT